MPERWIVIDRWDEFQHPDAMRSAVPPWIKTYTALLASDEFLELSFHLRGVLLGLWLEYASSGGQIRVSPGSLHRRLGHRVWSRDLAALNHAGFIQFAASKPASNRASRSASLEKKRRETPKSPLGNASNGPFVCGIDGCTVTYQTDARIAEHRANVHDIEPVHEPAHATNGNGSRTASPWLDELAQTVDLDQPAGTLDEGATG